MTRNSCNGLVVGTVSNDIRIPHKGNIQGDVIEGAFRVLEDFEVVDDNTAEMKALTLKPEESQAFSRAALSLRYGGASETAGRTPITAEQLDQPRRFEDQGATLWASLDALRWAKVGL